MPAPQITGCAHCGHHLEWHLHRTHGSDGVTSKLAPCSYLGNRIGGKCKCSFFCNGFRADDDKGITCLECGRSVFDHEDVKRSLDFNLATSQGHKIATTKNGIVYQVVPSGLMMCCRWTIYHFMRTHPDVSEKELRPGFAIKCVRCEDDSVLEIVPHSFQLGPTWAWKKPEPAKPVVVLPYD